MNNIEPCRCGCGGEAGIIDVEYHSEKPIAKMTICQKCGMRTDLYDTEAEAIEAWNKAMDKNKEENTPLTWNELKNLQGRPVYIISGQNHEHCRWFIIDKINNNRMEMIIKKEKKIYMKNGLGQYWNAYIKRG